MSCKVRERITCAALVAVLVFNAVAPIPIGIRAVDDLRVKRAEAIAPAIAASVVFATALVAYGVYVAGDNVATYEAGRDALYDDYIEKSGLSRDEADALMLSAVTGAGTVALGTLLNAGFYGTLQEMVTDMLGNGMASVGLNSLKTGSLKANVLSVNGIGLPVVAAEAPELYLSGERCYPTVWYMKPGSATLYQTYYKSENGFEQRAYSAGRKIYLTDNGWVLDGIHGGGSNTAAEYFYTDASDGTSNIKRLNRNKFRQLTGTDSTYGLYQILLNVMAGYGYVCYVNRDCMIALCGESDSIDLGLMYQGEITYTELALNLGGTVSETNVGGSSVVVDGKVAAGTAAFPTQEVNTFTPTGQLLQAGYTKLDVIDAELAETQREVTAVSSAIQQVLDKLDEIRAAQAAGGSAGSVDLSGVEARLDGIEATLDNGLSVDMSGVDATLDALNASVAANGESVDALTDSLGDVPDLLGQVVSGVSPISAILTAVNPIAGIASAVGTIVSSVASIAGVVAGVQASPFDWLSGWWQTLSGWWADLLGWLGMADLASWWRTLSGSWSSLLDWAGTRPIGEVIGAGVGSVVDALGVSGVVGALRTGVSDLADALDFAGVVSAVNAAAADISATIGVGTEAPEPSGEKKFALVPGAGDEFQRGLREKAPFAYVVALRDSFEKMAGRVDETPRFRAAIDVPYMGKMAFDAEPWLLSEYGGYTIAYMIRALLTAAVCVGCVICAYRAGMHALRQ